MTPAWVALACVAVAALLWIGGETHYRSCLQSVEVRYGPAPKVNDPSGVDRQLNEKLEDPARYRALNACSHLPF
jgi:hypothetical protein